MCSLYERQTVPSGDSRRPPSIRSIQRQKLRCQVHVLLPNATVFKNQQPSKTQRHASKPQNKREHRQQDQERNTPADFIITENTDAEAHQTMLCNRHFRSPQMNFQDAWFLSLIRSSKKTGSADCGLNHAGQSLETKS